MGRRYQNWSNRIIFIRKNKYFLSIAIECEKLQRKVFALFKRNEIVTEIGKDIADWQQKTTRDFFISLFFLFEHNRRLDNFLQIYRWRLTKNCNWKSRLLKTFCEICNKEILLFIVSSYLPTENICSYEWWLLQVFSFTWAIILFVTPGRMKLLLK